MIVRSIKTLAQCLLSAAPLRNFIWSCITTARRSRATRIISFCCLASLTHYGRTDLLGRVPTTSYPPSNLKCLGLVFCVDVEAFPFSSSSSFCFLVMRRGRKHSKVPPYTCTCLWFATLFETLFAGAEHLDRTKWKGKSKWDKSVFRCAIYVGKFIQDTGHSHRNSSYISL